MKPIKTADFVKSSSSLSECPDPSLPEYAFIGRSNVGKSSLINLLTNRNKLAKVSSKPGKTRLINHFIIDDSWYLVDLPGYGWANASKTDKAAWKKMVWEYFDNRENLTLVFVLIDSRLDPQDLDLRFIDDLGQKGVPLSLIFTKTDKLSKNKTQASIAKFKRVMMTNWEELPVDFQTSNVTGLGRDDIIKYIREVNRNLSDG